MRIKLVKEAVMGISFSRAGKNIAHEMRHRVSMCGSVGELESAVVSHIEHFPPQYVHNARFRYVEE